MPTAEDPPADRSATPETSAKASLGAAHLGIALVFAAFWAALGSFVVEGAARHDFLNLYIGASLAGQHRFAELHDPDVQLALERELVPQTAELAPFVRPAFYAALLSPLSRLRFGDALMVWLGLHATLLIAIWLWGARTFGADALILGAMFLPGPMGIAHGQDGVFLMAVAAGAWGLASRGREGAAGAVLALGLAKFHLFLFVFPALLLARRRVMLGWFVSTGAILALVSVALGGWSGAIRYAALLRNEELSRLSPSPDLMANVHAIGLNLGLDSAWISTAAVCLILALLAAACWKAPLHRLFPAMLAGSLLAPPHVYGYDLSLLLPAIWIAYFESQSRWVRATAGLLATPAPYLAALAGAPWPMLPPLCLLGFLAAHAAEGLAWRARTAHPV